MRLKNATGLYGPLLAATLAAASGGCSTGIDDVPPDFKTAPTIKAIYSTDFSYFLPGSRKTVSVE